MAGLVYRKVRLFLKQNKACTRSALQDFASGCQADDTAPHNTKIILHVCSSGCRRRLAQAQPSFRCWRCCQCLVKTEGRVDQIPSNASRNSEPDFRSWQALQQMPRKTEGAVNLVRLPDIGLRSPRMD